MFITMGVKMLLKLNMVAQYLTIAINFNFLNKNFNYFL
jgi:hypothetical protein